MPKRIIKHARNIHHNIRHHLHKPHCELCKHLSWYDWWHKQDIHRHIHYTAMAAGIILAVYFVMLDEIFSRVSL